MICSTSDSNPREAELDHVSGADVHSPSRSLDKGMMQECAPRQSHAA
jgi:hypothetical protein